MSTVNEGVGRKKWTEIIIWRVIILVVLNNNLYHFHSFTAAKTIFYCAFLSWNSAVGLVFSLLGLCKACLFFSESLRYWKKCHFGYKIPISDSWSVATSQTTQFSRVFVDEPRVFIEFAAFFTAYYIRSVAYQESDDNFNADLSTNKIKTR